MSLALQTMDDDVTISADATTQGIRRSFCWHVMMARWGQCTKCLNRSATSIMCNTWARAQTQEAHTTCVCVSQAAHLFPSCSNSSDVPVMPPWLSADFEARKQSLVIEGVHLSISLVIKLMQVM